MSLIRVYLLAKTFVFRNEHFQLVFKLKTTLLKIRAQIRILLIFSSIFVLKTTLFFYRDAEIMRQKQEKKKADAAAAAAGK